MAKLRISGKQIDNEPNDILKRYAIMFQLQSFTFILSFQHFIQNFLFLFQVSASSTETKDLFEYEMQLGG